jgi:hypothetical protein
MNLNFELIQTEQLKYKIFNANPFFLTIPGNSKAKNIDRVPSGRQVKYAIMRI